MPIVLKKHRAAPMRQRPYDPEGDDPAQLYDGQEEDQSPESWFTLPNALRVGGGIAGAIGGSVLPGFGTAAGAAIGGGLGAAAGEGLAQLMEIRRKQRTGFNPAQIGMQGAIGAIPMGRMGTIASGVLKGSALGAGATVGSHLAEADDLTAHITGTARDEFTEHLPSASDVGRGALYGGVFGGAASGVLSRFARPRAARADPAFDGSGPRPPVVPPPLGGFDPRQQPPPGGGPRQYLSAVSPRFKSFEPPPEVFPDPFEMAMAHQPNLPGAVQAGGRRMGGFDQADNIPPLPEGFDELNAILRGEDPALTFERPATTPPLTRPLIPSGLDAEPPATAPTPWRPSPADLEPTATYVGEQAGFDEIPGFPIFNIKGGASHGSTVSAETLREMGIDVPLTPAERLSRPEGPFPSMTRPLHPSGLDANPPILEAPVPDRSGARPPGPGSDFLDALVQRAEAEQPPPSRVQQTAVQEPPPAPPAGVPFMVTRQMEADLLARGYGQVEIDQMTPQQAHDILNQGPPKIPDAAAQREEGPSKIQLGGFKLPEAHVSTPFYESARRDMGIEPHPLELQERRTSDIGAPPGSQNRRLGKVPLFGQPAVPEPPPVSVGGQIAPERAPGPWEQNRATGAPTPPDVPTPVRTASTAPSGGRLRLEEVDADSIGVDAKTYQFKGGGDAAGATDRLKGVQSWDPMAGSATPIVVHERADGSRFVVDGHQRLALAKRMKAQGRPVPNLHAIILREGEGVTVEGARRIGAMLNLQQGTGTATDVAKVLRSKPLSDRERARIPKDQTSGAKLRMGEDLAQLGDVAFTRVVDGQVNPNPARNESYGAIVGRLIPDHQEQVSALQQLAKHAPDNAYQAEQFVKATIADGFERGIQTNLFGESEVANSLADPIARIMAAARRALTSEKSALGNALRNEGRLSARGNVLNQAANQAGFEQAGTLDRLLDTYGHTAGPVREELKRVAAQVQRGELTPAAASDVLLAAVERERGTLGGGGAARPGDAARGRPPAPPAPAPLAQEGAPAPPQPRRPIDRVQAAHKVLDTKAADIPGMDEADLRSLLTITKGSIVPEERELATLIKRELTSRNANRAKGKTPEGGLRPETVDLSASPAEIFGRLQRGEDVSLGKYPSMKDSQVNEAYQLGMVKSAADVERIGALSMQEFERLVRLRLPTAKATLPQATPAEVPGILKELADTLNVENKPLVDALPPLTLQGEKVKAPLTAAESGQGSVLDFDKGKDQQVHGELMDLLEKKVMGTPPTPMDRLVADLRGKNGQALRDQILAHPDAPQVRPEGPGAQGGSTPHQLAGILERSGGSKWRKAAEAVAREREAAPSDLPPELTHTAELAQKERVHAEIERLNRELNHPFGDRDDFSAFMETALEDVSLFDLRKALQDLQALKPRGGGPRVTDPNNPAGIPRTLPEAKAAVAADLTSAASDLPPELQALSEMGTRHEVRNPGKAAEIAESMKRVGWKGRKLLVIKQGTKETAWTGTHRLEAAKLAGLTPDQVPRVTVDAAVLELNGYNVDELAKLGKKARIEALRKSGQGEAADLLQEEVGAKAAREQGKAGKKKGREGAAPPQGSRAAGTNPRALGKNPRALKTAEEHLNEGNIDEAERMMSQEIEGKIKSAYRHGTGKKDDGTTLVGGALPFDTETFRRLVAKHPESAWKATTTALGGATGWYLDDDHPGRGAILGMLAGAGAGRLPRLVRALQTAEVKTGGRAAGVEPVRVARDPKKDIGLFELVGGTPERTIPEQFEKARPAYEKFLKALREEHARTKEPVPQKKVQAIRDRYMTPAIAQLRRDAKAAVADKANRQPYKASYITAFANRLAGHRTVGQRVVQALSKGKIPPDFIERRVAGGVYYVGTGFGVDTALQNLTQPMLALGHVPFRFVAQAYKDLASNPAAKRIVEGALLPLEKPTDAIEMVMGPFGRKASKFKDKLPDPQKLLRMTDQKNREVVYYAARKYAESQGMETAAADKWAHQVMRKTQAEPGSLGTNPFHAGPVSGSLRPFTKYPTVFTEHLIDLVKQASEGKNLGGAARLGGSLLALSAIGKAAGIDLEDLLISGGRPLGLDINHPGRSLERVATGAATPTSRGVFDLLDHLKGSADHSLTEDVGNLAVPRYARKLKDAIAHFQREGSEAAHVTRGAGGKIRDVTTPGETVLNLLGLKTTRQTARRESLTDFYDKATKQKEAHETGRRKAYEDLSRAIDAKDAAGTQEAIRRIGSPQAVRQFLRERRLLPEERFFRTLPPKIRQQLRGDLNETRDLAVPR